MRYTKDQVRAIYNETARRLYMMIRSDSFEDENNLREYENAMLQGVYSALVATASNWPEVDQWCRAIENA